jgi:replicative DNA helicase
MARAPTEATVLGAVMILGRKKLPAEVSQLSVECFTEPQYAYVWQEIESCLADGLDCDEVTVWDRIAKDQDKTAGITYDFHCLTAMCPSTVNLDHWAKILAMEGEERTLSARTAEVMANRDMDAATKAAEVQRLLMGAKPKANEIRRVKDLMAPWFVEFEREKSDPDRGVVAKTGIPTLDKKTKLKAGEMTIIAGRPGMGKSAIAGNVAAYCAKRNNGDVAMFSLEMTSSAVISRLVTSAAGMNIGHEIRDHEWAKIQEAASKISGMSLWIDDRPGMSAHEIRAALMRVPKTRLIVVDYIGLMAKDKRAERHDIAIGELAKDLRALAKDFEAHAIVLCQLNRKVEDRPVPIPALGDLRDSGNLEEHADNVWFVYRQGYYDRRKDEKAPDRDAQIIIAKQRHGEVGIADISWDGATQRFFDSETRRDEAHDWQRAAAGDRA